jgi:LPXTG-motif cell wall-anchored protein
LKQNQDYVVTGIDQSPLIPAWAALLLALGAVLLAWKREGR